MLFPDLRKCSNCFWMSLWQCTTASIHFSLLLAAGHRLLHMEWKEERKISKHVKFFKTFAGFRKLADFKGVFQYFKRSFFSCYFVWKQRHQHKLLNLLLIASKIIAISLSNIVGCFMFIAFYVFFFSNPQIMGDWTEFFHLWHW